MKPIGEFSLVYITDLDNKNYRNYVEEMRENLKHIIRASNLSIARLASLVGITRLTLKRFIIDDNNLISFITANKFNNFVYRTHKDYSSSKIILLCSKNNMSISI